MAAVLFVVTFAGTGAAFAYQSLQGGVERHDLDDILGSDRPTTTEPDNPDDALEGEAYNILVMGTDSREGEENASLGGGQDSVEGMRSDTTLLVHVAADRSRVDVVSIPRDLLVTIPSCQLPDGTSTYEQYDTMFNSAFALGGGTGDVGYAAGCTVRTVEAMTGIFIHDFVVVDMAGFKDMVDAIGGVDMCFDEDLYSEDAKLDISAGCHTLDGETALAVARARKGVGLGDGSDIGRIDRQQELLTNMVEQVLDRNILTNSTELYQFLQAATSSLTTSERIGNLTTMAGLAYSLRGTEMDGVNFATVPFDWAGNRVRPNYLSEELWTSIRDDEPMALPPDPDATDEAPDGTGDTGDTAGGDGTDDTAGAGEG
ncbi:cell envelope-related function transcriptional attenuator common domain-containing protein [Ruania alba]|uniref:Cell envelope-related function transcriptional attenuator common domain-containing protein n=2 Tax=Ruania alba TaxID=648782 RepID=A0A1H5N8W8_9MICO|nr:cell envelope-related function transcriptional attenuator common domain-containing protein [Ruania alba]